MNKFNWIDITRDDVIQAIEKFLILNPEYPEPRSTYLIYKGKKLPAKHIRGMAYKEHYGISISKNDFGGGMETVKFFERLGFEMDYQGEAGNNIKKKRNEVSTTIPKKNINKNVVQQVNYTEKISISSKKVVEQKNALQLILNQLFSGDIVCEKTFSWLKTPKRIEGNYRSLYDALTSYRNDTAFAKKEVTLRCDFVCESKKLIIEYDERQHFSMARKIALESYREVPVFYDRDLWIKACESINAKDNFPYNRDEVRAYYDSVRDIECYKHGYKLVRIMHGQIDFEGVNAVDELKKLLGDSITTQNKKAEEFLEDNIMQLPSIKIAMYLQTDELKNEREFEKIKSILKVSDVDIVVFPECCYVPFAREIENSDILEDQGSVFEECLKLSKEIGKAIIVCCCDRYNTIFSVFANAQPLENETEVKLYIKHTMCGSSCLEFGNYPKIAKYLFSPILYKGYQIGTTICYDCNHALFSRMYGMYGIDLIINSTGGDVVYDKWFKYNKARAIENSCYNLVTMGGDGTIPNSHNYVFGFNRNGGILSPDNLCGNSLKNNIPGGIYVYTLGDAKDFSEDDNSNQIETENKKWHLQYPSHNGNEFLEKTTKITDNIFHKEIAGWNVFFLIVEENEILKAEKVQPLLYSNYLKKYDNRRYIIINRHGVVDKDYFRKKLSLILKVRAMENFCAVILESDNINKCYQCGKNRTAQVVKSVAGYWGIDLERTSGPEAIWKNKMGMKASWRKNYEWLVENCEKMYDN